jgi:hypothetical protein
VPIHKVIKSSLSNTRLTILAFGRYESKRPFSVIGSNGHKSTCSFIFSTIKLTNIFNGINPKGKMRFDYLK